MSQRFGALFRANLMLGFFLVGCAYILGLPLFSGSTLPLKLSVFWVVATVVGQVVAWRADGGRGRLFLYGIFNILGACSLYLFIAGISWVFYFSSESMPFAVRFICVVAAVSGTILWATLIGRQVSAVLDKSDFLAHVFKDAGNEIEYRLPGIQQVSAYADARGAGARIGLGLVLLAAPVVFLVSRVVTPFPASRDLLLFVALLLCPASQLIMGIIVKAYLLMIRLPLRLERTHGKPVILIDE
ncbi:hypothetical protein [Burkholderia stabilis]|uniref:hypothetical protein n=2 Tax=Burkholderia stabilis TaxID=95485 RepID=UPI001F4A56EB|nr:hypothetical protein [Burkholderia stabilis]